MFDPIVLSTEGDTLKNDNHFLKDHTDESEFPKGAMIGFHAMCGMGLEFFTISHSHKVITCKRCCMRIAIPSNITTYGALRNHFAELLKREVREVTVPIA